MKTFEVSRALRKITMLFVILSLAGCATISTFDQHAYAQTTSAKVDALNVMSKATADYQKNEKSVVALQTELDKIYEYEKNRPKNEITIKMWKILLNKNGHLLGGFLTRWKKESHLNKTFITEEKKLVGSAFDQIAGLESHKIKKSEISD